MTKSRRISQYKSKTTKLTKQLPQYSKGKNKK